MTPDAIGSLVRQVLTALLASGAGAAYMDSAQATALAGALGVIVSVGWSIVSHWNKAKVKVQ